MRLFFGLAVSDEVGAAAAALIERLRACGAEYRWAKPKGLHLTLNFLGETPLEHLPALEEVLRRAAARPPFDIAFGGPGAFDSLEDPRIIWVGLTRGAAARGARAEACGPRDRPFCPHLTLGRRRGGAAGEEMKAALKAVPPLGLTQSVDRLILFESRPSDAGSLYLPLKEAPLLG